MMIQQLFVLRIIGIAVDDLDELLLSLSRIESDSIENMKQSGRDVRDVELTFQDSTSARAVMERAKVYNPLCVKLTPVVWREEEDAEYALI